jgi:type VI secretion system protein ImpL
VNGFGGGGLTQIIQSQWLLIIYGIIGCIGAGIASIWSKYPVRYILALITGGVIIAVYCNWSAFGDSNDLDGRLPPYFMPQFFIIWVAVLTLAAIYSLCHLGVVWYRLNYGTAAEESAETAKFPDLESAWQEIQNQLSQARYDAGNQKIFLVLATDESVASSWMRASGHQFFAVAPVGDEAPIHAYATSDGLFISCAGASAWGRGDDEGNARLENLCRKILELNPDLPPLRGVAVLYPLAQAATPELLKKAGALRNDLQTIRGELKVRCPTFAVLCLHEVYAGFDEFAARMPARLRMSRSGFSVPLALTLDRASIGQGLRWLAQWFFSWSLSLMKEDFNNKEGNSKLVTMNAQLWRDMERLRNLLEASFSTHARAEPIMARGVYFSACGAEPESFAFVAGLIKGDGGKMIADSSCTMWSAGADAYDRRYRNLSLAMGLATAAIALPIWFSAIMGRVPWLGWVGLAFLIVVWLVGLIIPVLRERALAKGPV